MLLSKVRTHLPNSWCHRPGSYSIDLHGHKDILYFLMFISQISLNSTTVYRVSFSEFIKQTAGLE